MEYQIKQSELKKLEETYRGLKVSKEAIMHDLSMAFEKDHRTAIITTEGSDNTGTATYVFYFRGIEVKAETKWLDGECTCVTMEVFQ